MYRSSQLIASHDTVFSLNIESNTIVIRFTDNCDIDSLLKQLHSDDFHSSNNLSLHLENLRGNDMLPVIDVYLNLDREIGLNENNYIGPMALYGLAESSTQSNEHGEVGQQILFDVGQVFKKVRSQSNWSKKQFKLTLVPVRELPINIGLTIERVTLFFNKN